MKNTFIILKHVIFCACLCIILSGCSKNVKDLVSEQLDLGEKYLDENDYESAILALQKAIELDPKNIEAYELLAQVYENWNSNDEAIPNLIMIYETLIELDVEEPDYYLSLAEIYRDSDHPDDAVAVLENGLEHTSDIEIEEELDDIRSSHQTESSTPSPQETTASAEETTAQNPNTALFQALPTNFTFANGISNWTTELYLNPDGTFTGEYDDVNRGENTADYPYGTIYVCNFNGEFSDPQQIDVYTYSVSLESLETEHVPGEVLSQDDFRYISTDPHGLTNAENILIYLPGATVSDLPVDLLLMSGINVDSPSVLPPGVYALYSENDSAMFIGLNAEQLQ